MTESTATYTIDPPAPTPESFERRITELEQAYASIIVEQMLHVKALDQLQELPAPVFSEALLSESPRAHMRIQITKNTKGYSFETSVSVDAADLDVVRDQAKQLLIDADTIARQEIERRELLDGTVQS